MIVSGIKRKALEHPDVIVISDSDAGSDFDHDVVTRECKRCRRYRAKLKLELLPHDDPNCRPCLRKKLHARTQTAPDHEFASHVRKMILNIHKRVGICTITFDDVIALWQIQQGLCHYTQRKLSMSRNKDWECRIQVLNPTKPCTEQNIILIARECIKSKIWSKNSIQRMLRSREQLRSSDAVYLANPIIKQDEIEKQSDVLLNALLTRTKRLWKDAQLRDVLSVFKRQNARCFLTGLVLKVCAGLRCYGNQDDFEAVPMLIDAEQPVSITNIALVALPFTPVQQGQPEQEGYRPGWTRDKAQEVFQFWKSQKGFFYLEYVLRSGDIM